MRKPAAKVSSISGPHEPDLISQAELRDLENLQRLEWTIGKRAAMSSERIKSRIEHGATVEDGVLYFDRELEMVRSKKKDAAGETPRPARKEGKA